MELSGFAAVVGSWKSHIGRPVAWPEGSEARQELGFMGQLWLQGEHPASWLCEYSFGFFTQLS